MDSSNDRLSRLQRDLLEAFFDRATGFALTGGAALGGFLLHHRESKELDLFTRPPADLAMGEAALAAAANACGASIASQVRYPDFRRFLATRREETTLVDLVIDRAPAVDDDVTFGRVRVHSMREIAANKICTLLGRCEIRDLVDLRALLEAGVELDQALLDAAKKDAGANPATLAWLLSELRIEDGTNLPADLDPATIDTFRRDLVKRLRAIAFPG